MFEYSFGPLLVSSALELPELKKHSGASDGVRISILVGNEGLDPAFVASTTTREDGGYAIQQSASNGYMTFRFDASVDFVVDANQTAVEIRPSRRADGPTTRHYLLDQVLPRIVEAHGHLVLHAAGVETSHGTALLMGQSGAGKSSLAGALHREGFTLLGDDCFVVTPTSNGVQIASTYPSLRLLPDSINHLYRRRSADVSEIGTCNPKRRIRFKVAQADHVRTAAAIFILDIDQKHRAEPIAAALAPRLAVMHLVRNSFRFDASDSTSAERAFDTADRVASVVDIYDLRYRRRFAELRPTVRAVTDALGA